MANSEKTYSLIQYFKVLREIKTISEDMSIIPGGLVNHLSSNLVLLNFCTDEQENDWEHIGLRRKASNGLVRASYFYSSRYKGMKDWSLTQAARYVHDRSTRFSNISPRILKESFVQLLEPVLNDYLTERARIKKETTELQFRFGKKLGIL